MIKKIKISDIDKEKILDHICPTDPGLDKMDFTGIVVNKPWGYEYLMFQNEEISIWMLYIKKGYSTSMHCHPKKKTSLLLISGNAICSTLNNKFELKEKDALVFDKGVFHQTEAISENGIFVLETETPSDKTDLFRLRDNYKRELKAYTEKKNITNKTYNYHYLFLDNHRDSTDIFGKYKFYLRKFNKNEQFSKEIKSIDADLGIILEGEIRLENEILNKADIVNLDKLKKGELISPSKILLLHEIKNSIKLSDYVISFLEKRGINNVFLVSGGNLMHLLESIRVNKNMNYLCNHHEQASAMAAESYSKLTNNLGFAMVTSGPGGTNAITGVAGAWIDSNPLLVISGQAYNTQTIGKTKLRQLGIQEVDIVNIVRPITKYAVMVKDPNKIKYHLEKAIYLATHGRPGPVWLDIPVNIQAVMIEEKNLDSFNPPKEKVKCIDLNEKIKETIELIKKSKRPIILLGNGVRLGKSEQEFYQLIKKLPFPIVTSRNANDLIWEDQELYAGRVGSFGQRSANFAVQNSDLLLSLGSRISLAVTGWAYKDFAREAKKIIVDIDKSELKKPIIKPDIPINCDVKGFILEFLKELKESDVPNISEWKERINYWKKKYSFPKYENNIDDAVDIYYFIEQLSNKLNNEDVIVTDMGMSFQCTMQNLKLKKGQRLFTSSGLAPMGFGLPGAIGACIGNNKKRTICITGDGGLQMNIQELQTIFHNNLPIKIFIINNKGYASIRETQKTYFKGYTAAEPNSGVSMPDIIKIGKAYNIKTKQIENQRNLNEDLKEVLDYDGPVICDINISTKQQVQPKQGMYFRPDGKPVPRPIEDMSPFIDREELKKDMIIDTILFDTYKN